MDVIACVKTTHLESSNVNILASRSILQILDGRKLWFDKISFNFYLYTSKNIRT